MLVENDESEKSDNATSCLGDETETEEERGKVSSLLKPDLTTNKCKIAKCLPKK